MPKPKGGRGHAAPYYTKLMRVPVPLENQIHELIDRYQDFIDQGGNSLLPPPLLDAIADHPEQTPLSENQELKQQHDKLVNELSTLSKDLAECEGEYERYKNIANQYLEELNLLRTKPVNELSQTSAKPVNDFEVNAHLDLDKQGLNQQQLANLFGLSHTAVGKHKLRETFAEWSKQHDPSGQAWKYDQKSRMFYPLAIS